MRCPILFFLFFILFSFSIFSLFLVLLGKCVFLFFSKKCRFQHLYWCLTKDVSSVVGAPWRCGVLTTSGGIAGIGLGRLLEGEHDSTPQSGVEARRLIKRSLSRLYYCC